MDTVVINGGDFYFFVIFTPKNIRERDSQRTLVFVRIDSVLQFVKIGNLILGVDDR